MGFYIMLCTVHTTQGQGQGQGTIVFYRAHPISYPCSSHAPSSVYEPGPNFVVHCGGTTLRSIYGSTILDEL